MLLMGTDSAVLDAVGSLCLILCSLAGAALGLDGLGALYAAYALALMLLDDEEWLLQNCLRGPAVLLHDAHAHHGVQRRGGQRTGGGLLGRVPGGDAGVPHLLGSMAASGGRVFGPRGCPARVLGVRSKGLGEPVQATVGDPPPAPAGMQAALGVQQHPCQRQHVRVVRGGGVEERQAAGEEVLAAALGAPGRDAGRERALLSGQDLGLQIAHHHASVGGRELVENRRAAARHGFERVQTGHFISGPAGRGLSSRNRGAYPVAPPQCNNQTRNAPSPTHVSGQQFCPTPFGMPHQCSDRITYYQNLSQQREPKMSRC